MNRLACAKRLQSGQEKQATVRASILSPGGCGEGHDPLHGGQRDAMRATVARSVRLNASQPPLGEPATLAPNAFASRLQRDGNVVVHEAFGGVKHDRARNTRRAVVRRSRAKRVKV
ncbi:MAG: hypothetical protein P0121_02485 [Nitrospira sp.]|nr:hypothetical protein [Nitrospira sp.]